MGCTNSTDGKAKKTGFRHDPRERCKKKMKRGPDTGSIASASCSMSFANCSLSYAGGSATSMASQQPAGGSSSVPHRREKDRRKRSALFSDLMEDEGATCSADGDETTGTTSTKPQQQDECKEQDPRPLGHQQPNWRAKASAQAERILLASVPRTEESLPTSDTATSLSLSPAESLQQGYRYKSSQELQRLFPPTVQYPPEGSASNEVSSNNPLIAPSCSSDVLSDSSNRTATYSAASTQTGGGKDSHSQFGMAAAAKDCSSLAPRRSGIASTVSAYSAADAVPQTEMSSASVSSLLEASLAAEVSGILSPFLGRSSSPYTAS